MPETDQTTFARRETATRPALRRALSGGIGRAVRFVVVLVSLGVFYTSVSPTAYPTNRPLGLWHGALHGGLMPMALPSLLLGRDVPIYAANNLGRPYKIGYILGINTCGLLVFGTALARPRAKDPRPTQPPA